MGIACENIRQHGAYAGGQRAIERRKQEAAEQHHAVPQVHVAVHGRRDGNDDG